MVTPALSRDVLDSSAGSGDSTHHLWKLSNQDFDEAVLSCDFDSSTSPQKKRTTSRNASDITEYTVRNGKGEHHGVTKHVGPSKRSHIQKSLPLSQRSSLSKSESAEEVDSLTHLNGIQKELSDSPKYQSPFTTHMHVTLNLIRSSEKNLVDALVEIFHVCQNCQGFSITSI